MTTDQLESLLTSVLSKTITEIMSNILEKFDTCFDKLLGKFEMNLDKYYADLHDVNVRLDKLEHSVAAIDKGYADFSATGHSPPTESRALYERNRRLTQRCKCFWQSKRRKRNESNASVTSSSPVFQRCQVPPIMWHFLISARTTWWLSQDQCTVAALVVPLVINQRSWRLPWTVTQLWRIWLNPPRCCELQTQLSEMSISTEI